MRKGYTLVELVVAVAILAIVASFAGAIFKVGIESHRIAGANAEIMQKLRAITDQLNADFKGLRKDGEIYVVWSARPDDDLGRYVRFDRIMFFANGDFHTYHQRWGDVRGNVARISYMLANRPPAVAGKALVEPQELPWRRRILARTQHILTADTSVSYTPPTAFDDPDQRRLHEWHNHEEYDVMTLGHWLQMPWDPVNQIGKADLLTVISDVYAEANDVAPEHRIGAVVDPVIDNNSVHMLLCEGVGEFTIQGWHDGLQRWVPEAVDFDGPDDLPFVLYPYNPMAPVFSSGAFGKVKIGGILADTVNWHRDKLNKERFNEIPGLGRALKFTFTLYDSRGIIQGGRTFTHIVYLDD
jgi:prepilin-type N-terminal cleavage/methylation domain-containing protein